MPLYYFHIHNGLGFTRDEEGQELADAAEAMDVALRSARSLIAAEAAEGRIDLRGRLEVTDSQDEPLFDLPFADSIVILTGDVLQS
jgi:hypothetical protein